MKKIKTPLLMLLAVVMLMTVISIVPTADFYGGPTDETLPPEPDVTLIHSLSGTFLNGYSPSDLLIDGAETTLAKVKFDSSTYPYLNLDSNGSPNGYGAYYYDGQNDIYYGESTYLVDKTYSYRYELYIDDYQHYKFADDVEVEIDGVKFEVHKESNTCIHFYSPHYYLESAGNCIVNFSSSEESFTPVVTGQGTVIEPPATMFVDYHEFAGWYTEPDGKGQLFDFSTTPVTESMTVYAYYTIIEGNIHNVNANLALALDDSFYIGADVLNATEARGLNLAFDSSYEDFIYTGDSEICLGAFTVDGEEYLDDQYVAGTYYFQYLFTAEPHHTFADDITVGLIIDGEDPVPCEILENNVDHIIVKSPLFYLTSNEHQYIVNFVSGVDDPTSVEVAENQKATPPTVERESYDFGGWYTEPDGKGEKIDFATTPITDNMTVYAYWKQYFTVIFDTTVDGYSIKPQKVYANGKATAPKTEHPDYVFLGWYTKERNADLNDDKYDFNTPVTANKTIYAYWARYTKLYAYDISNHKINQGGTVSIGSVDNFKKNVSSTTYYNPDEDNYSDWIKAKADSGYVFREWRLISNDVEANEYTAENAPYFCSDRECIFQRTTQAYTIYAVFEKQGKHTISKIPYKEATCTKNGNNEYYYCKDCRKYYTDSAGKNETTPEKQIIYCTGKHYFEYKKVSVYPTFTQNGKDLYICKLCGEKSELSLPKYNYPNKLKVKKFKKKGFKASWNKTLGVEGYQIEYSLKKDFGGSKTILVESDSVNKWKVTGLKKKKKYYVRVRAYVVNNGNMVYSPWTPVKKVKTK